MKQLKLYAHLFNALHIEGRKREERGGSQYKVSVFGIIERGGKVKVEVVKDVTTKEPLKTTVKTVRRGSIVYTDRFKSY